MTVMAPADENECRQMLYTAFQLNTPAAVRYPRGSGPGVAIRKAMQALPIGKGEVRRQGARIAILAFGSMLAPALAAAEELDATVANMRFVKPLDEALVEQLAREHELLVTVEENAVMGGAGSAVAEYLAAAGLTRAAAAPGPARPLRRSWRSRRAAGRSAGSTRTASARAPSDDRITWSELTATYCASGILASKLPIVKESASHDVDCKRLPS